MAKKSLQSAFAAASKLLKKMPDAQRQQFMQKAGGLFGGGDEFQGLGSVRNMYQAMQQMDPQQQAQMSQQLSGLLPQPGQPPVGQPQTLGQTVQQQQFAKQQQGSNAQTGTGGTPSATPPSPPSGINNNLNSTANTTPAISPSSSGAIQFGKGPLTSGVSTDQLQESITASPALNAPPISSNQIFQAQYNPLINTPGQADIMNQLSGVGRSNVMGQYGAGGYAGTVGQEATNQAALQGPQGAQQLIGENLKHTLGAQQLGSQFDMAGRQQHVQHLGAILNPAVQGIAAGNQQALQGTSGLPQFLG